MYSFGENDIYHLVLQNEPGSKIRKFQRAWQKIFGFAPILFAGRGIFNYDVGLIPYRVPINTVGKCFSSRSDDFNMLGTRAAYELYGAY